MTALAGLLFVSMMLAWVPQRWAASLLETGSFALAAVWALRVLLRQAKVETTRLLFPLTVAVLWGAVQALLGGSIYERETWGAVLRWGTNLAVFAVALQVFAHRKQLQRFLGTSLVFGFALSVIATLAMFTSQGRVFWVFPVDSEAGIAGPFLSRNQYAAFIELMLPLALARNRPLYAVMAAAMYASVIASASRAGFVITSLEIVAVLALTGRVKNISGRAIGRVTLALGIAAAVFVAVVGWQTLLGRMSRADPYAGRREMLASTLDMVRERPWTGFGLGTWSTVYPAYARYDDGLFANHAHNDWAEWAAEGGLPFAALLAVIAVWSVRPALRSRWGIGIPAVFAHGLVDYPLQKPALAALLFAMLAALACDSLLKKGRPLPDARGATIAPDAGGYSQADLHTRRSTAGAWDQ